MEFDGSVRTIRTAEGRIPDFIILWR